MSKQEISQQYQQQRPCNDITRYPDSVEFKMSALTGCLIDKDTHAVINTWGDIDTAKVSQAQQWLKTEQKLKDTRQHS